MRCICRFLVAAASAAADDVSIIGAAADWQCTAHKHIVDARHWINRSTTEAISPSAVKWCQVTLWLTNYETQKSCNFPPLLALVKAILYSASTRISYILCVSGHHFWEARDESTDACHWSNKIVKKKIDQFNFQRYESVTIHISIESTWYSCGWSLY